MNPTNWIEPEKVTASHAWRRWSARMLDYLIYGFIMGIMLISTIGLDTYINLMSGISWFEAYIKGILFIAISILINAIFIYCFGNTLGKKIFGIKIVNLDNSNYNFYLLLKRELLVFQEGTFYALPILEVFARYLSYKCLISTKSTGWDKQLNFKIIYRPQKLFTTICTILPVILYCGWVYLYTYSEIFNSFLKYIYAK